MPVPVEAGGCYMKIEFPPQIPLTSIEYTYVGYSAFQGTDISLSVLSVDQDVFLGR